GGEAVLAAGIPWYVAVFGRDALITSHQLLMVNPKPARDTLRFLAKRQGTREDDWRDEQPGRILHEIRRGELAGAGVVPHTPYYGSVDATPLFLLLYAQHFRWTGDLEFARERRCSEERPSACARGSTRRSGSRTRGSSPVRSTRRSARFERSCRTRGTGCTATSWIPSGPRRWPAASSRRTCSPAGGSAR